MKIRSATGIYSRPNTKEFNENYDRIFRKAKTDKADDRFVSLSQVLSSKKQKKPA